MDLPCTRTIQFLLRSGHVDAVVYMRSNDAIWGLPYDIFLFTMLQEMLAVELALSWAAIFTRLPLCISMSGICGSLKK